MRILEKVYDRSPIAIQNLMCSVKGYINSLTRYGAEYYNYLDFLEKFDNLTYETQKQYQLLKLRDFIKYAYDNSPFYHNLYQGLDINITSLDDLKKFPIVDKEMLRANIKNVYTIHRGYTEGHTGGTTGKSLVVRGTVADGMHRMAQLDYFKARLGFINLKMKRATFNGKHIVPSIQKGKVFWRYNSAVKQMIYSSFHLTEENIGYYVESLNKFKPDALDGFFTSMCDIAGYIERHSIKLAFKPIAIFPTSETLTPRGRELLERIFCAKVYDQYSSSEGAPFVYECENQVLHMAINSGLIEHLADDSNEILVTSFTTHGTPLIRYRIGDSMVFSDVGGCTCRMHGEIVKSIEGRRLDFLYTPEGGKINAGNVANLLKNLPNVVIRTQFVQNKRDEINVNIEVDKAKYKPDFELNLRDEFKHKFGDRMKVNINIVDEIPRSTSGKFRMIINNIVDKDDPYI